MAADSSIAAPKVSTSLFTLLPLKSVPKFPLVTITKHNTNVIKNNAVIATILIFSRPEPTGVITRRSLHTIHPLLQKKYHSQQVLHRNLK